MQCSRSYKGGKAAAAAMRMELGQYVSTGWLRHEDARLKSARTFPAEPTLKPKWHTCLETYSEEPEATQASAPADANR